MSKKFQLRFDLLVVLGIIVAAIPLVVYFQVRFLTSTFFFFIIPSVYLLIRKAKRIKRILLASFLFGVLFTFPFDFLAEFNNAWRWPAKENLLFPYLIFGIVPVDVMIWYFFWTFSIFVFYEHFFEHDRSDKISPHFKFALYPILAASAGLFILFAINPNILKFTYAYLLLGLVALLPFLFIIRREPAFLPKFLKVNLFFIFLYVSFELTSLKLNHWHFPGQYIGTVNLLGFRFPFEELFFWILMSSTVVLSYYKFFVDNEK